MLKNSSLSCVMQGHSKLQYKEGLMCSLLAGSRPGTGQNFQIEIICLGALLVRGILRWEFGISRSDLSHFSLCSLTLIKILLCRSTVKFLCQFLFGLNVYMCFLHLNSCEVYICFCFILLCFFTEIFFFVSFPSHHGPKNDVSVCVLSNSKIQCTFSTDKSPYSIVVM